VSEYQYYDFRALDRPLTRDEMATLRSISTRAAITATSFTNHYEWGDLKANPSELLEKYFDAFVYVANWGTRAFYIRLPRGSIDYRLLKAMVRSRMRPRAGRTSPGICQGLMRCRQVAGSGKTQVTRQDRDSCGLRHLPPVTYSGSGHGRNFAYHNAGGSKELDLCRMARNRSESSIPCN
jgi:hypothetical protein